MARQTDVEETRPLESRQRDFEARGQTDRLRGDVAAGIQTDVRKVVQVIGTAERLEVLARSVELADLEDVLGVASTPVADDDRPVSGLNGVPRFQTRRKRDLLLDLVRRTVDEQMFGVERRDENASLADRQRVGADPATELPESKPTGRIDLPDAAGTVWIVRTAVGNVELPGDGTGGDVVGILDEEDLDVLEALVGVDVEDVDDGRQLTDDVEQTVEHGHSTNHVYTPTFCVLVR